MQIVLQDPFASLNPAHSVGHTLGRALALHRSTAEPGRGPAELLDAVGLEPELLGARPHELSGGQRQRVAIARALLRDTPVVILDEATTGLDPAARALVLDAVDRLARGRTTLIVTHDADVAVRADRVVWIEEGRVLLDGPPSRLLAESRRFRAWAASAAVGADGKGAP